MKRKAIFINFLAIVISFLTVLINNTQDLSINSRLVLFILYFMLIVIFSIVRMKGIKNCFFNINFIYSCVFFAYSFIGPLIFVIDNYSPRYYYFFYNTATMNQALQIYVNIYIIFNILSFTFNKIKVIDMKTQIDKLKAKTLNLNNTLTIFDFLALFSTFYCLIKLILCGTSFFNLSTLQKRDVLNSGISHYINLYVIVYSLFLVLPFLFKNQKKNFAFYVRIFNISIYWAIFLTCERSVFVAFLIGFIMLFATKLEKIKLKHILTIIFIFVLFLFSAAMRENISFSNHKINDVLYSSTTEYYCTFTITNALLNYNGKLNYGKTYYYDSFTKLFPSFILKNKPKDLSQQFKEQNNLNVGFAFNPVAEGIINFGTIGATIFVPILMLFITSIAEKLGKINILYYVIVACYSLYYCRGAFSNFFFDIIFCYITIFCIYKVNFLGGKNENDRINNISQVF